MLLAGQKWMTYMTSGKFTPILSAEVATTTLTHPESFLNELVMRLLYYGHVIEW